MFTKNLCILTELESVFFSLHVISIRRYGQKCALWPFVGLQTITGDPCFEVLSSLMYTTNILTFIPSGVTSHLTDTERHSVYMDGRLGSFVENSLIGRLHGDHCSIKWRLNKKFCFLISTDSQVVVL